MICIQFYPMSLLVHMYLRIVRDGKFAQPSFTFIPCKHKWEDLLRSDSATVKCKTACALANLAAVNPEAIRGCLARVDGRALMAATRHVVSRAQVPPPPTPSPQHF